MVEGDGEFIKRLYCEGISLEGDQQNFFLVSLDHHGLPITSLSSQNASTKVPSTWAGRDLGIRIEPEASVC